MKTCLLQQLSGFTRERSTMDAILALRLLSELHRGWKGHQMSSTSKSKPPSNQWIETSSGKPCIAASVYPLSSEAHRGPPHWNHITCETRRSSIWQFFHNIRCPSSLHIGPYSLRVINWIPSRCVGNLEPNVGNENFTDLNYADDAILFKEIPVGEHPALSILKTRLHTFWDCTHPRSKQRYNTCDPGVLQLSLRSLVS